MLILKSPIAIDATGKLLGKIVDGQQGLDEPLRFTAQDIAASRPYWGFLSRCRIRRWHEVTWLGKGEAMLISTK